MDQEPCAVARVGDRFGVWVYEIEVTRINLYYL